MADKIKLLPDTVANQIAAGEVVNRPASVVKEMMENAVDAGATAITVSYRNSGKELIRIIDDGEGMSPIDARLAFDKHATSKITNIDDVYRLHTFGFRGEALASIAAIAHVELTTRQPSEELGIKIIMEGSRFQSQEMAVAPVGSQFSVKNLFFNVPARRRVLETSTTEHRHIVEEFRRVALTHPEISFALYGEEAPIYNLSPSNLRQRIVGLIGKSIANNLLEVQTDTSIIKLRGFVGRPSASKQNNREQYLFVNGRYFRSPYLHKAILQAYEKLIAKGTQPSYFLYLEVDPDKLDVNIHPQKTEVRFEEGVAVWQIVNAAVREALAKTGAVPPMDFDEKGNVEIPVRRAEGPCKVPPASMNPLYNPFASGKNGLSVGAPNKESLSGNFEFSRRDGLSDGASGNGPSTGTPGVSYDGGSPHIDHAAKADASDFSFPYRTGLDGMGRDELIGKFDESVLEFIDGESGEQPRLIEEDRYADQSPILKGALPLAGSMIATSRRGQLVIVDLQRAKEVILYHRYLAMLHNDTSVSQKLMFPEVMVFSSDDVRLLKDHEEDFNSFGFEYSILDDNRVDIAGIPADFLLEEIQPLIYDMIDGLRDETLRPEDMRRERMAAIMSSAGSGRLSKSFTEGEITAILESLSDGGRYNYTHDGRPVMTELGFDQLRKLFTR